MAYDYPMQRVYRGAESSHSPDKTGCTLLRSMVKASKSESLSTASSTTALVVKMRAILLWRPMISTQKKSPITSEVVDDTMAANLAPMPFPAPSSLATRTLNKNSQCACPG